MSEAAPVIDQGTPGGSEGDSGQTPLPTVINTPPGDPSPEPGGTVVTPPPAAAGDQPPAGEPPPAPTWMESAPDDWREMLAGEDTTKLNLLKRVPSFSQLVDNYANAQEKIRTGSIEAAAVPTEDSTPEEWAEYRAANEIPETPDDYKLSLDEGLVLGPDDDEVLAQVYPVAHEMNLSTSQVSQLTNAMVKAQAAQFHQAVLQQGEYQKEADAAVKATWGADYETNKQVLNNVILNSLPENVRDEFAHATLADGRKVFNSPEMMIAMADWAKKMDPHATVMPASGNPSKAINDEITELENRMGTPEWYKDQAAQQRYQQLITARDTYGKQ